MNVQELARAAQSLSFEQRRELIKMLFAQQPQPGTQEPSIVAGDLEAGIQEIQEKVNASLTTTAANLAAEQANGLAAPPQHNSNLNWLEEHRAEYAGQWVALHNGKLIAHSADGEALVAPVRQAGVHSPMIVFVEPPGAEVFVGF